MSSNVFNPRKPLFWLGAVAAAAAFFASGALVARATIDDGEDDDSDDIVQQVTVPGLAVGEPHPATFPASAGENDGATTQAGRGGMDMTYPACRAPLPVGLLSGAQIDWAKASFAPALPAAGFSALNFSVGMQGECGPDGVTAAGGSLVLSTGWVHDETELEAYVTQIASTEKVAPVLRDNSATFWANGYLFNVGVNSYRILPVAEDGPTRDSGPAPADLPASGSGSSASAAGVGRIAPPSAADPRAAEVLAQLIAQLSPSTEMKCFYTVVPGDWSSLADSGVGDPRPAIPAGFVAVDMYATAFQDPAAGCDTSLKPTDGFNFNANWQKEGQAYIGVSVYSTGGSEDHPGNISEYGANWSRGGLQFGVYAKAGQGLGIETIRAIAKALDPQFDEACFVQDRKLSDGDLAALGFSPATAPDGYKLQSSYMSASEIAAGCSKPQGFEPSYSLNWSFSNGADTIEAGAHRYGGNTTGSGSGYRSKNNLSWTSSNGTNYYVNAYSRGINPEVSEDALVAVAKSMDPAFDISKLVESPDGGGVKPLPAVDPASPPERSAR